MGFKTDIYFIDLLDAPSSFSGQSLKGVRVNVGEDGVEFYTVTDSDEKVKVDSGAIAGYLGITNNDGVLRVGSNLSYDDGGDFVTIDVDATKVSNWNSAYSKRVDTWGDGLEYSSQTASIDFNTTNLKITANELNTIQNISLGAAPTFLVTNFTGTLLAFISTPSSAPSSDYQIANKKYVDDSVSVENLWDRAGTTLSPHNANDVVRVDNKIAFTQVDLNEYIDSLNDGYVDIGATTGIRFNNRTLISKTSAGVADTQLRLQNLANTVGTAARLSFRMWDSNSTVQTYGRIATEIDVNTNASEESTMRFHVWEGGEAAEYLNLNGNTETVNVLKDTVVTGDLIVNGGDIGLTADTDLIQLAADSVRINGELGIGAAPSYPLHVVSTTVPSGLDYLLHFDWQCAIPSGTFPVALGGYTKDTGSNASSGGHLLGVLGWCEDNVNSQYPSYAVEGRVDSHTSNAITHKGMMSYVRWVDSDASDATTNQTTLVGLDIESEIFDYDGVTPRAEGTFYGVKVGSITGGANNYGMYIADMTAGSVGVGIAIAGADSACLWLSEGADNIDAANGIIFGGSADTNLYRSAANTLKTDDSFQIGGSLSQLGGSTGVSLSGANGVLTMAGIGGSNNENLTLDFETTANQVAIGTGTGVTKITTALDILISGDSQICKFETLADNDGITLTSSDFGKTITVNSASAQTVTLPSVSATDIGAWFKIVKLGTGKVIIATADYDMIADSGGGGTIYNDNTSESWATITLQLVSSNKWVLFGSHGSWFTTD